MYKGSEKFIVKSKTSQGDCAKQYFQIIKAPAMEEALIITKLVLSKDFNLYRRECDIIKKYKGFYLFKTSFGLKISTLDQVIPWVYSLKSNEIDSLNN